MSAEAPRELSQQERRVQTGIELFNLLNSAIVQNLPPEAVEHFERPRKRLPIARLVDFQTGRRIKGSRIQVAPDDHADIINLNDHRLSLHHEIDVYLEEDFYIHRIGLITVDEKRPQEYLNVKVYVKNAKPVDARWVARNETLDQTSPEAEQAFRQVVTELFNPQAAQAKAA